MHKKNKQTNKDGSGSSKRRREIQIAQSSHLLPGSELLNEDVDDSFNSKLQAQSSKKSSKSILNKLKQCAYPVQRTTPVKQVGPPAEKSSRKATGYSQIEQLLSADKDLQFRKL